MITQPGNTPSSQEPTKPQPKPIFNPLYDYEPSQSQLESMNEESLRQLHHFQISRKQIGYIKFMGPVDLSNANLMEDVQIEGGQVAVYPGLDCRGMNSKGLNQSALVVLEIPKGPHLIEEIKRRLEEDEKVEYYRIQQTQVLFKVKEWCHYRVFGEGPAPPKQTRGFEEEQSDGSQEDRPSGMRIPISQETEYQDARDSPQKRILPQPLFKHYDLEEEKTGVPQEQNDKEEEEYHGKSNTVALVHNFFAQEEAEVEASGVLKKVESSEAEREKRVLHFLVNQLWSEFKHSSGEILHQFDELSNWRLPEVSGQQAPPQYNDPTKLQSVTDFLSFFEKTIQLLSGNSIKNGKATYKEEIRLLSLLSVLKKGVFLQGQDASRTIQESMIVRNELLEWLRKYCKIDLELEEMTIREKIRAATFLQDLPWLNSLKQECENNGTPILSKIIRSIIKKKSYVKFPQRQKREYIEKLLVVNDIGLDLLETFRFVLYKEELHMSKEDWKLKLFYDLAHNPNTAYCDTLRAVLPEEPTSANQEQALIYYHFTDSSQRSVYLEQIMAHSKKLDPLVRLILLYYLSFQAKREKDSVLERKNLNPTAFIAEAFDQTQDELLKHNLLKQNFIVSFLLVPLKMSDRFDRIVDLVERINDTKTLKSIFKLFEDPSDSQFLYYLQGEYAIKKGNFRMAMSSFLKSRHVHKSYRVFMDYVVDGFVKGFPWRRLRVPYQAEDLSEEEQRALIEMKGRINECGKLKYHYLKEWQQEGQKYQEFFDIATILITEHIRVQQCKSLHERIKSLHMDDNMCSAFKRLGKVLSRWRREISLYNQSLLEENTLTKELYEEDELDSFNLV